MVIRKTRIEELDEVMRIYARAAEYMAQTGNPNQWKNGYPSRELIVADIRHGVSYVADVNGSIEAVFMYFEGADASYARIDNGAWHVPGPYAVFHRIASAGRMRGIGRQCFAWCEAQAASHGCSSLRADTHADNKVMQHVLQQSGFTYCGVIYLEDGAPRLAYEKPLGQTAGQGNAYVAINGSYYANQRPKQKGDGVALGVASMVLGIISILLFCTCANFLTAVLAIIFGIIQIVQNKDKTFAITGIITASLSIVFGIVLWMILVFGMSDASINSYDDIYEYYYGNEYYDEIYDGDYRDDYDDYYDYDDYFDYDEEESGAEFL